MAQVLDSPPTEGAVATEVAAAVASLADNTYSHLLAFVDDFAEHGVKQLNAVLSAFNAALDDTVAAAASPWEPPHDDMIR